jgi:hypothetical protein
MTGLTGRAEERPAAAYCLPYKDLQKRPTNTFTLKMATATLAETLDNFQHSTQFIPESRSFRVEVTFLREIAICRPNVRQTFNK